MRVKELAYEGEVAGLYAPRLEIPAPPPVMDFYVDAPLRGIAYAESAGLSDQAQIDSDLDFVVRKNSGTAIKAVVWAQLH